MIKVQISLLGNLSIKYNGESLMRFEEASKAGKRWVLFAYLLLNRDRLVTKEELIDLLWPNEAVKNPANSLKILIYQLRRGMDSFGIIDGNEVIISQHTGYRFSPKVEVELDIDTFEKLALRYESEDSYDKKFAIAKEVLGLYNGDFYEGIDDSPWVESVQQKYRNLFHRILSDSCKTLYEQGKYQDVVYSCNRLILSDPYIDEYYYLIIRAYLELGNYKSATNIYDRLTEMLLQNYGEKPDTAFENEFREKCKGLSKPNLTLEHLVELMNVDEYTEDGNCDCDEKAQGGSDRCDEVENRDGSSESSGTVADKWNNKESGLYLTYTEFRVVYRVAKRVRFDGPENHYLCLFTLAGKKGARFTEKEKKKLRETLRKSIQKNLKPEDIITSITANQYAVLLAELTEEEKNIVIENIVTTYERIAASGKTGLLVKDTKIT